jgi:LysM repeat protein
MGIIKYLHIPFLSWIIITANIISVSSQTIDSTKFSFHKVLKNETSYGIAKKYQISLNDFFFANPNASKGISKGEIVKIPLKFFNNKEIGIEIDTVIKKHKVLRGETLWSISKIYGVQLSLIKSYNNLNSNSLKDNQILLIPNIIADTVNQITPLIKHVNHPLLNRCDTIIIHKVKKKETLYAISKKYQIGLDKIIRNNPFLEEEGLKKEQELKIIYRLKDCAEDSIGTHTDSLLLINQSTNNSVINISLLLPFFIDYSDSIIKECPENTTCAIKKITEKSILTYNGIKIALDELKEKGYNIELSIFDTQYDTTTIKEILSDSLFLNTQLIIGPLYSKNIKLVRSYSKNYQIPMVSPYNIPSQALFNYPNLYKLNSSRSTQSKEIATFIRKNIINDNILLIVDKEDRKSMVYGSIFSDEYNDSIYLMDSINPLDSVLIMNVKRGEDWSFMEKRLSKKTNNIFVVCSNKVPFLTYAFNQIIGFSNTQNHYKSKFTVFGFEDLYRMNTIDVKYKNKFNLHFSSNGIINYNAENVISFINNYRNKFLSEPTTFAFESYDMVKSIFLQVFPADTNSSFVYTGLKNDVIFNKIEDNSGSENIKVKFYSLNNFILNQLFEN